MSGFNDKIMVVIDASSKGAVQEMDRLQKAAKGADLSVKDMGRTLKTGLVAGAAAFIGGGIVAVLNDSVAAFQEAQTAATQWARATNASVQEAGKFTTVAKAVGLSLNDLIEINAEFSQKIKQQPDLLKQLNVEIAKNADGSTNMTKTLVSTIDALGQLPDGLKAAQIASKLFGEEGSKQLAGFYLAGIKVSDLMDRINFVDKSDDAKAYAASTMELNLAFQQLQIEIGSRLVPVLTTLIDAGMALGSFLGGIPTSVYLAVGAFVAINKALAFFRSELAATILIGAIDNVIAPLGGALLEGEGAVGKMKSAFSGLAGAIGPANLAVAGIAAAFALVETSAANTRAEVEEFLPMLKKLENAGNSSADALRQTAASWEDSASFWDKFGLAMSDSNWNWLAPNRWTNSLMEAFKSGGIDIENFKKKLQESREEMGEAAYQAGMAEVAQRELNDIIATGEQRQGELKDAVNAAGAAQAEQARLTDNNRALMDAYAASTYGAVSATMAYFDAAYAAEDAQKKLNDAIKAYNENPTADTSSDVLQAARDNAAAATRAWEEAQVAAGIAVTQMAKDAQYLSSLKIQLQQPGLPPDAAAKLQAEIDGVTAALLREGGFNIPVGVDLTPEEIQTALDRAKQRLAEAQANGDLNAQTKLTADITAYETTLANIKNGEKPTTSVTVTADTGTAKTDIDGVATDRTARVEIDVTNPKGATSVIDEVANKQRTAKITIDVTNPKGATWVIDQVANKQRTAYIDVKTRGLAAALAAVEAAEQASIGLGQGAAAASRSANMMFSPINMVRVSLDGRELRSVIDDEIRALTPTRQEVA